MIPHEYVHLSGRTEPHNLPVWTEDQQRMIHAALGLSTELGELIDPIKRHVIYGKPLSEDMIINMREELGDALWYVAILCRVFGWSLEGIMRDNVAKLLQRYPEKFTPEDAQRRADKQ